MATPVILNPMTHENSIITYHETPAERKVRKEAVLQVYRERMTNLSDRMVASIMGFKDMNAVRPRITELVAAGDLIEVGKIRDELTKRPVRMCRAKQFQTDLFL